MPQFSCMFLNAHLVLDMHFLKIDAKGMNKNQCLILYVETLMLNINGTESRQFNLLS